MFSLDTSLLLYRTTHLFGVAFAHSAAHGRGGVFGLIFLRLGHAARMRGVVLPTKFHAAVDAGKDFAAPTLDFVLLHLVFLAVRAAAGALKENHDGGEVVESFIEY